jgi:phage terminase large subunit-like protein
MSDQAIADELRVSRTVVRKARLEGCPTARPPVPALVASLGPATPGPSDGGGDGENDAGEALGLEDQRRILSEQMREAHELCRRLQDANDLGGAAAQSRLVATFAAALKRITAPEPPADPNAHPDMVAAAAAARAKLGDLAERWRLGKARGPGRAGPSSGSLSSSELSQALDEAWAECTTVELAGLAYDWPGWWARPEQVPPDSDWSSWGFLTGRRFGKTRAIAEWVHREAMSGRAMRIALIAQNEDKTWEVMIEGECGLVAVAPPWERPIVTGKRLVWPNGAQAFPFTPEVPRAIRGPGFHLSWCSEFCAWPPNRRDEALSNVRLMTSLGYSRMVWDSTPKRKHPIIREMLKRSAAQPRIHPTVRGTSRDNVNNISPRALAEWEDDWGGTTKGREELLGEFIDDSIGVLWSQDWIDDHRREMPARLARRVIAVDPAISTRRGTDATGLVECGTDEGGQVYVIEDLSGRLAWEVWGALVIERYIRGELDCVVVERNRGGDAVVANLRACGRDRGVRVEVLDDGAATAHFESVVFVKEVQAKSAKESRAEPVATLYQKGRVSHVIGADLSELEEQMTTWEPTDVRGAQRSPNNLDAAVWAIWELVGLAREGAKDRRGAVRGIGDLQAALKRSHGSGLVGGRSPVAWPGQGGRSLSRI